MAKVRKAPERTVKLTSPYGSKVTVGEGGAAAYVAAGYKPVPVRSAPAKKTAKK